MEKTPPAAGAQSLKSLTAMQETWVQSLGWGDPLDKEMATHSSILAWENPQTEESGGLQPWGHRESDRTEWASMQEYVHSNVEISGSQFSCLSKRGDFSFLPQCRDIRAWRGQRHHCSSRADLSEWSWVGNRGS